MNAHAQPAWMRTPVKVTGTNGDTAVNAPRGWLFHFTIVTIYSMYIY